MLGEWLIDVIEFPVCPVIGSSLPIPSNHITLITNHITLITACPV